MSSRFFYVFLVLFISSCAVGYRTKDVDKALDRNDRELAKMDSKIGADIKNKNLLLQCFSSADTKSSDSSNIKEQLDELEIRQSSLSKLRKRLEKTSDKIREDLKGKKSITSNDKEFPEFKKSLDELEDIYRELEVAVNHYTKTSNQLNKEAKKRQLLLLNFDTIESDLEKASKSADLSVKTSQIEIANARKAVSKYPKALRQKKNMLLDNMLALLKLAQDESLDAKSSIRALSKEYPSKGLVCLSPQHKNYKYINEVKESATRVAEIERELKKIAREFQKSPAEAKP